MTQLDQLLAMVLIIFTLVLIVCFVAAGAALLCEFIYEKFRKK